MAKASGGAKTEALYAFDQQYSKPGALLCGVDEAGAGPLCGPLAVAAVVLDYACPVYGVDDSKKISEPKRELLYGQIIKAAVCWNVVLISPGEIDQMNILAARMLGMKLAVEGLAQPPALALLDGNRAPDMPCACQLVVGGDGLSACIAAASILAKVTRDRLMRELDREYPQYQLARHKGYGTKLHYEMLDQHGIQDFYRMSFLKKWMARR